LLITTLPPLDHRFRAEERGQETVPPKGDLRPGQARPRGRDDVGVIRREQYQRLEGHLRTVGRSSIELTFAEVAEVIGEPLPASAYRHPAWWASDPKHTQAVCVP
jgi:hypothetical protein